MLRDGKLLADGSPEEVITDENLFLLYNAEVSVIELAMGLRVCMPKVLKNGRFKMTV